MQWQGKHHQGKQSCQAKQHQYKQHQDPPPPGALHSNKRLEWEMELEEISGMQAVGWGMDRQ